MKRVAIVGSHPCGRNLVPWGDMDIKIWVFNAGAIMDWCKRADVVFEMHPAGEYTNPLNENSEYWNNFLQKQMAADIYMQDIDVRIPKSKKYPFDGIVKKYLKNFRRGGEVNRYFTSSPCYAIALALYLGYDTIDIYGIEMETNSEYIYQRDGVGLWVGIALGVGANINITKNTTMFSASLYGYDDDHNIITRETFEENANAIQREFDEASKKLEFSKGRLDNCIARIETMKKNGEKPHTIAKMGEEYGNRMKEYEQCLANYANLNGQLTLCRYFIARIEKMQMANGKAREIMALRSEKIRSVGLVA